MLRLGSEAVFEKIILVTRKTRLDELIERFNTQAQAKFYIERAGGDFSAYVLEHEAYQRSLEVVRRRIEIGLKIQVMDRALVPTYVFSKNDIIVTLGQDGLVANTAKYVSGQPILAVNPDAERFDGILLPFQPADLRLNLEQTFAGKARVRTVTLAEALLKDGQRLLAFNDLFIGAGTHVSARYRIRYHDTSEDHSSSGIIVSTGAGSTGWLSSIFNETSGILSFLGGAPVKPLSMAWEEEKLLFVVREPFVSRHSQATIVAGTIAPKAPLALESQMPGGGVIFSDGVEADHLDFNSGAIVSIRIAPERANLVVPEQL
jgi:NAD kinase